MATAGPARGGRGGFSYPPSILGTPGLRGSWRLSRSLSPPSSRSALVVFWVRTPIPSRGGCAGVPEGPGSTSIVTTASGALARAARRSPGAPDPGDPAPRGPLEERKMAAAARLGAPGPAREEPPH